MSKGSPPRLNEGTFRTAPQVREVAQPRADFLHDIALSVVALERLRAVPAGSDAAEELREREYALLVRRDPDVDVALAHPAEEPAADGASTAHARGRADVGSTARIASFIAARLVPSGAVDLTSNSASSTSLGMYSCRTQPVERDRPTMATAASDQHHRSRAARIAQPSSRAYDRSRKP